MALIRIRVVPNAKSNRVVPEEGQLRVYVTAPPDAGRANGALVVLLAGHFNTKKSHIRIIRGERSRDKVVEVLP